MNDAIEFMYSIFSVFEDSNISVYFVVIRSNFSITSSSIALFLKNMNIKRQMITTPIKDKTIDNENSSCLSSYLFFNLGHFPFVSLYT